MKPTRKRRVCMETLNAAVRLAIRTSATNATRAFGITPNTILAECRRQGHPTRRVGNFTLHEIDAMAGLLRF